MRCGSIWNLINLVFSHNIANGLQGQGNVNASMLRTFAEMRWPPQLLFLRCRHAPGGPSRLACVKWHSGAPERKSKMHYITVPEGQSEYRLWIMGSPEKKSFSNLLKFNEIQCSRWCVCVGTESWGFFFLLYRLEFGFWRIYWQKLLHKINWLQMCIKILHNE